MSEQHWNAEEQRAGWALLYDPTPGGRKNADGTTSFSLRFPAFITSEWISEPEKVAKDVALALNCQRELLVALKNAAKILPKYAMKGETTGDDETLDAVLEQISEAIAKAEGGTA